MYFVQLRTLYQNNMKKLTLDELKAVQLEILDAVAEFCNQKQITYFLLGGTLLGAVRHQGYIPWDDDIDIGMLRGDYQRFITEFNQHFKESQYYLYVNTDETPNCCYPFIKVCKKGTYLKENGLNEQIQYGINIDIFPIDDFSSQSGKEAAQQIHQLRKRFYYKGMNVKYALSGLSSAKGKEKLSIVLRILANCWFRFTSYRTIVQQMDAILHQEKAKINRNEPYYRGHLVWGYGVRELTSAEVFDEITLVPFEGRQFTAPKDYHTWLTNVFGDYMKLPPIEQQQPRHAIDAYLLD